MKNFDLAAYLKDLEAVVNIDSHAEDIAGVTKVEEYYKSLLQEGYSCKNVDLGPTVANGVEITNTDEDTYDVLLMAHVDTVFHAGTVAQRPFKNENGIITGPGSNDMKAGGILGCHALMNLVEELKPLKICLALNPEEEQSSVHARPWLEELSKKSKNVIILEPARSKGQHVEERKGLGRIFVTFHGVASHAGNAPAKGRSAIHEMAYWTCKMLELHDIEGGFTVNVGSVEGGTGANIVADYCKIAIDIRMTAMEQVKAWEACLEELKAHAATKEISVEVEGGVKRPPMFKTPATEELIALCNAAAAKAGVPCEWVKAGGGSDGNFSAALGIPTVDGFGPTGDGSHSDHEYVVEASIAPAYDVLVNILFMLKDKLYK